MNDHWQTKQFGTTIDINAEDNTRFKERVDAAYAEMARNLNTSMYADGPPPPPPTRVHRWRRRATLFGTRVRDAWLVLTGRAEIGDGW